MKLKATIIFLLSLATLLSSCASLNPYAEKPEVSVESFTLLSADSFSPEFQIGLRVINPNKQAINVEGLSYSAIIEGQTLLSGVNKSALTIDGYSEKTIQLNAKASLFNGLKVLSTIFKNPNNSTVYRLKIKMDVGSFKIPIVVTRKGTIALLNQ